MARNPDRESKLTYRLYVSIEGGLVLKALNPHASREEVYAVRRAQLQAEQWSYRRHPVRKVRAAARQRLRNSSRSGVTATDHRPRYALSPERRGNRAPNSAEPGRSGRDGRPR